MRIFVILLLSLATDVSLIAAETAWPSADWESSTPEEVGLDPALLKKARDYALTGGGSGFITRHGKLVMSWGDPAKRYDLKSTTKSIGITALGLALADDKLELTDRVVKHHPSFATPPASNQQTGWVKQITIQQLATQTAGFEKPGGYTKLTFKPGTKWAYSDGGPNWLAECITLVYQRDVQELMFERIFTPLGIKRKDLTWRRNSYRDVKIAGVMRREFGSGISANVDAMARIGYLYLRGGKWKGQQLVPKSFVQAASTQAKELVGLPVVDSKRFGNASDHYGLLWWNNANSTLKGVPSDAYWSWGLYESLIVVIPSLDIVVTRAGRGWKRNWAGHYDVLQPFLNPIVAAAQKCNVAPKRKAPAQSPYPSSPVFRGIEWAPVETIVRKAKGSDNWPITWGDNDALYTAYGDGRGFVPYVEQKLSMGLCRITGTPSNFQGVNLRSSTAERKGGGASGPKVSSMLMVNGVLYMFVRNTANSQLAWSSNRGRTWTWSDWRFETSFGYPVFLNFGKNYEGARDRYVYLYSHNSDSAYQRADHMVLARVPSDEIRRREAYEFFQSLGDNGPVWTSSIDQRGAVFINKGSCYRSSVSYNKQLKRYLWCQTGEGKDTRFAGGFAIYDAPQPWGPWTTVFSTKKWDVGPGETSCLPTKWMSEDGRHVHLVFSGDDCFSVRKGTFVLKRSP